MGGYVRTLESIKDAVAAGPGRVFAGDGFHDLTVQVEGITTATVDVEVSNDGATWYSDPAVTPLAADGIEELTPGYKYYRANMTAWTSGTVTATIHGK